MSESIKQKVVLNAPALDVYNALISSDQFTKFSKQTAKINAVEGGAFELFDKKIIGYNLSLKEGRHIVQAWKSISWDDREFSIVRFYLTEASGETIIEFEHVGYPHVEHDHLSMGWQKMYWEPLRSFLANYEKKVS